MDSVTVVGARFEHRIRWPYNETGYELCRAHFPAETCPCQEYRLIWMTR